MHQTTIKKTYQDWTDTMQWPQALGTFESLKVCARSLAHSLNTSSIRLASIGLFWFQGTPLHRLVTH